MLSCPTNDLFPPQQYFILFVYFIESFEENRRKKTSLCNWLENKQLFAGPLLALTFNCKLDNKNKGK